MRAAFLFLAPTQVPVCPWQHYKLWMDFLAFDLVAVDDGVSSLEAMASTAAGQRGAVMAEVQQVLWTGHGNDSRTPMAR